MMGAIQRESDRAPARSASLVRRAAAPARRLAVLLLAAVIAPQAGRAGTPRPPAADSRVPRRVPRVELLEAMRAEEGYDPAKITNAARFQGSVLLRLARRATEVRPDGPPLFIDHEDWYQGLLQKAGLSDDEAPLFARLAREHGQDLLVYYRADRIISRVRRGPEPRLALNVTAWWQEAEGVPSRYSFDDTLSVPKLRVTYRRIILHRLLEFDDMMAFDEIRGLTGRPTSGLLGLLFKLIGEGRVVYSRMAVSPDGLLIVRARSKKAVFKVTTTVTVQPDGTAEKDLPPGRDDLKEIEKRLAKALEIDYHPWSYGDRPPSAQFR